VSEPISTQNQDLILKLDAARATEIATVRATMETFLRGQIELEHKMEIVAANQNGLKERFEEGVSKRLTNLDKKFDAFMIEWGTKKSEDTQRDKEIVTAKESAKGAHKRADLILNSFAIAVCGGVLLFCLVWSIGKLLH
jgi:hypothetical protein